MVYLDGVADNAAPAPAAPGAAAGADVDGNDPDLVNIVES